MTFVQIVIPAKAGIQKVGTLGLDSRFRGNDGGGKIADKGGLFR